MPSRGVVLSREGREEGKVDQVVSSVTFAPRGTAQSTQETLEAATQGLEVVVVGVDHCPAMLKMARDWGKLARGCTSHVLGNTLNSVSPLLATHARKALVEVGYTVAKSEDVVLSILDTFWVHASPANQAVAGAALHHWFAKHCPGRTLMRVRSVGKKYGVRHLHAALYLHSHDWVEKAVAAGCFSIPGSQALDFLRTPAVLTNMAVSAAFACWYVWSWMQLSSYVLLFTFSSPPQVPPRPEAD
eukprot:TRINITY_DN3730_c0_g2_i7.p3 TRINITY_DN3730_c0_g2~~TRINITY_DN3730_c0_g2_i7.p3  ORF type:complete len:244 (-),score=79.01 TRINITY_DN3730_c0_g2_i7:319-1050(-)